VVHVEVVRDLQADKKNEPGFHFRENIKRRKSKKVKRPWRCLFRHPRRLVAGIHRKKARWIPDNQYRE
jgi:hypothetical protein